jgi:hypothetical protein
MSIKDNLGPAITALVLPMVFSLMHAAGRRKARRVSEVSIVEYPGIAKALGILAIGASALMLFVAFRAPEKERVMALSFCGVFSLLFFFLPLEFFFRRIEFDEREIVIHCAWRVARRIPWTEVISFQPQPPRKEWILQTKNHGKIQFSSFLQGLQDLDAAVRAARATRTSLESSPNQPSR